MEVACTVLLAYCYVMYFYSILHIALSFPICYVHYVTSAVTFGF